MRRAADGLQASAIPGRFHHRRTVEQSPEIDLMVRRAVARAKAGDRDAVRYLYLRYSDNVYSYARSLVRDDHEAEDITQHVFAKLLCAIGRYEERGRPFSGWILRLTHNVAIDALRARRAMPAEQIHGREAQHDEAVLDRSCLRAALGTLPDEQRNVLVLRHVVGLSPTEIADRLGRSESSVHGLHHRGRRAMRDQLARLDVAPAIAGAPPDAVAA